jgi:murein DD-endopeptidase MepM/ murein hydrolase activator NlpD
VTPRVLAGVTAVVVAAVLVCGAGAGLTGITAAAGCPTGGPATSPSPGTATPAGPTSPPDICPTPAPGGWVTPVHAAIWSGFRTAARPGHDGVDLAAGRGTPIRAAAAGTVAVVTCDTDPDPPHRCDRDGSPTTPGCGWYVDLRHPDHVMTRYCHLLHRPALTAGQQVVAGQAIGVAGTSGHSSGPHLHFEVHIGGSDAASAVDPVAFMAAAGAPLGSTPGPTRRSDAKRVGVTRRRESRCFRRPGRR